MSKNTPVLESETAAAHKRIIRRYNVLGTHFDVDAR